MCATEEAQCCSADYLESVNNEIHERLEQFLEEEFEGVIEDYQDEVDDLLECELL